MKAAYVKRRVRKLHPLKRPRSRTRRFIRMRARQMTSRQCDRQFIMSEKVIPSCPTMSGYRLMLLLVLLLATIQDGSSTNTVNAVKGLSDVIEGKVRDVLAKLVNSPIYNPTYNIHNATININSGRTKLSGYIDGVVEGIPDARLERNKFTVIGMKLTAGLFFPKLVARGTYKLEGALSVLLLDAGGNFSIELENLNATVLAFVSLDGSLRALQVKVVTANLTLDRFHVQIDNILGDLSDAFNKMVNEIAPEIFAAYKPQIYNFVTGLVKKLIRSVMSEDGVTPQLLDRDQVDKMAGEIAHHVLAAVIRETVY